MFLFRILINVKNLKGIILHFVGFGNKLPWDIANSFYEEWKSNLDRAELIDLDNIPEGKKWDKFHIYLYSLDILIRKYFRNPLSQKNIFSN